MWNEIIELPGGSYFVSNIQSYFEYILKKHETVTDNPQITICVIRIENRTKFKINTGSYINF